MNNGDWVVSETKGECTYPGKIMLKVHETFVIKIFDFGGEPYEIHRHQSIVRRATKQDFDRLILDANAAQVHIENFIAKAYEYQKEVI